MDSSDSDDDAPLAQKEVKIGFGEKIKRGERTGRREKKETQKERREREEEEEERRSDWVRSTHGKVELNLRREEEIEQRREFQASQRRWWQRIRDHVDAVGTPRRFVSSGVRTARGSVKKRW